MSYRRLSYLALALILVASVGCKGGPRAAKSSAFAGTWNAVSAHHELEKEIFAASMVLDVDGYALAHASEKDHEQDASGQRVAIEGETYAIQGSWERQTDRRIRMVFEIEEDDEVVRMYAVGWRTGPDTMVVTIFSPERAFEAFVVGVERVADPDGTQRPAKD